MGQDDQKWFDEVFIATAPMVRRYILSLYRAFPWLPYDPDDIIQEVYFCLYEKRKKIYDPSGLKSWLIKTTQNKAFDVGRDYAKRYKIIDRFVEVESRKGESNIVAGVPVYNFGLYMELCEQKIGKKNMEMLQRYYVDKESIKIIAKEAGVAVPIMRMRFHRWKKYCAQIIRSVIRADLMLIIGIAIYKNSIK